MCGIVGNENIRSLWDALASSRGDHEFLVFEDCEGEISRFTYAEFDAAINRTANYFLELGVAKGQNVAVQLYNSPEFLAVTFALAKIGAVAVPINMQHKVEECAFVYERCDVRVLVTEPDFQEFYFGEDAGCSVETVLVCHARGARLEQGAIDFDSAVLRQDEKLSEHRAIDPHDTAEIMFTSGTTSCPKGVELTHYNLLYSGLYGDWEFALTPEDRFLTTMPAFHSNFQLSALMPVLTVGATLVFVRKYSARRFWKQVRAHRATAVQAVAMMARTMMMQPVDPHEREHEVRTVQYYLAISDAEKDAFERRFGVRLQNCYGSTESVCWVLTDFAYGKGNWPSVGRPGLGYEVDVVDEDGASCAPGVIGEIVVGGICGETLMKGYYRDEDATRRAFDKAGRFRTGDKGYRDESGWFFFVDRKSNMIKRAGENISASEVEDVLLDHPGVAEAAVIGVDDPVRDQAVKAFVVFKEGACVDERSLQSYCATRLADFKVPTIFEFLDGLPHTSVGKVAKKLLR
ncbi:MAG: crotonobetaine/carnitine-CoA ligase [Slackia sp.]|nr:crotonobetaine/carnitine-CoA ligase [Slackia sp.]